MTSTLCAAICQGGGETPYILACMVILWVMFFTFTTQRVVQFVYFCCCSTREIKPDGPGIGVRVKVRHPVLPPRRDRNPVSSLAPSGMHLKHNYPPKPLNNGYVSSSHHGIVNGNSMPNLAHTKPQGNNYAQKPGNPEIMRRPLRYINWNFACEYYALWFPDIVLTLQRGGI